jgi:type IV pilus assembly protein PilC
MALLVEYAYRAVDAKSGGVVKGVLEAPGKPAVVSKLRAQGLLPLDVTPVSRTGLNQEIKLFPDSERRVKLKPLAIFARQLSGLINAGLPLMRALAVLIEQSEDAGLRASLTSVQADVESGLSFSAALAKYPQAFPPLMVSLVRVGETGGFLGDSLALVAKTYQSDAELRDKLKAASTYPMVVLVIALSAVAFMVTFIVPVFEGMFTSLGGELPLPTQILVTVSHNMIWILPLMVVLGLGGWFWWLKNRNTVAVRRVIDPRKLKMPVFGPLMTKLAVARFARNLSMMLTAGVPLIQALASVSQAANNWAVEQAIAAVQQWPRLVSSRRWLPRWSRSARSRGLCRTCLAPWPTSTKPRRRRPPNSSPALSNPF